VESQAQCDVHKIVADCQAAMHYADLHVTDSIGNMTTIDSLFDSGNQVSILRADAIKQLCYESIGEVRLRTFDNRVSIGDLISLEVRLDDNHSSVPILFVVCNKVFHDCLLFLADYHKLLDQKSNSAVSSVTIQSCVGETALGVANTNDNIDGCNIPTKADESDKPEDVNMGDDSTGIIQPSIAQHGVILPVSRS